MNGNHVSGRLDAIVVDRFDEQAAKTPDRIAAEWQGETLTYSGLQNASLHVSRALLSAGVTPRAKVPLLAQMSLEMLPAIIGILRVGACYAPMDVAAWSRSRVEAALSSLSSPVALVTTPCPGLQLPVITVDFQNEWLHSQVENAGDLEVQLYAIRNGMRQDDLAWILFTSGTTGKPKGVMVYHRAVYAYSLVDIMGDSDLPTAVGEGFRCLLAFSVGFDGCASVIWASLTKGHAVIMASPSNFPEVAATCDALMLTPSMLAVLDPSGPYDRIRYILLGAEDPSLEVVRQWITPNRKVFNTYGPSETTCIITLGEIKPDKEITFGQLNPGFKVVLVDEDLQECDHGEVLIAGPGLAAGYINNPELTAKKFIQWHGERFYRTGDLARRTEKEEFVWAGRADSLVKNRGFLINLETEVEPALLSLPPVQLAVALKCRDRLVGYVQPANVNVEELRALMKGRFDPFVIPDDILAVDSFPLSINGKVDRNALREQREEIMTRSGDEDLVQDGHVDAYDALRLAFSKCLHVTFIELGKDSSFTRLGGTSFAAIRLSNLLKKHGYMVSPVQILRLDTIGLLEESLKRLSNSDGPEQDDDSKEVPVTGTQRMFLTRSLQNPILCALISKTEYVGNRHAIPTASELHDAFVKALLAHSIFQTRFDLSNFTLSNLGRLNLDWNEVSIPEAEFEKACAAAEKKAWLDMNAVTRSDNEVPYFHITCVSVPGRKALAFITRIHHILLDVVSQALLSQDVERALAGEQVPQGPRIQDFARFMHKHKQESLERAIAAFDNMVKPLPATSVLQPPTPPLKQSFDLMRLDSHTSICKSALDAVARCQRLTGSTMAYAAWALFLRSITSWDRVGFRVSLSGRTVPWAGAQSVVGALVDSAPFSIAIATHITVHEWLAQVHKTTLNVLEFDGLGLSLPESFRADKRTNTTSVLCFLDLPLHTTPNWKHSEKQEHSYLMSWYVFPDGEGVATTFEFQSRQVDEEWAREVAGIPGQMLEGLVNATKETLIGDLLRYPVALLQARGALL